MIRYSDDDRERMRREQVAASAHAQRERLYFHWLIDNGHMGVADRRPVSRELMEKIGNLEIDPSRRTRNQGSTDPG